MPHLRLRRPDRTTGWVDWDRGGRSGSAQLPVSAFQSRRTQSLASRSPREVSPSRRMSAGALRFSRRSGAPRVAGCCTGPGWRARRVHKTGGRSAATAVALEVRGIARPIPLNPSSGAGCTRPRLAPTRCDTSTSSSVRPPRGRMRVRTAPRSVRGLAPLAYRVARFFPLGESGHAGLEAAEPRPLAPPRRLAGADCRPRADAPLPNEGLPVPAAFRNTWIRPGLVASQLVFQVP